jgi:hypothetical protein
MYNFKSKKENLKQLNSYSFAKTFSMFEWENLPSTIPRKQLEKLLQVEGYAFITEVDGSLYAFTGGLGGLPNVYGEPTEIIVTNPALNLSKKFNLETDGVLILNDDSKIGTQPLINKFNSFLVEIELSLSMTNFQSRMQTLISADDDKTKTSAELFISKVEDGELSVIGNTPFFEGIKSHIGSNGSHSPITSLLELQQYVKASLHNELGLNSNFNMKRERLTSGEVDAVEDTLYPFIDNMMNCRLEGVEKLNEKYGLNVSVDYGSVWSKKNSELVDGIVEHVEPVEVIEAVEVEEIEAVEVEEVEEVEPEPEPEPVEEIEPVEEGEENEKN